MGLIKAVIGTAVSTLAETWKDYYVCDSMDNDVLMVKGVKKGSLTSSDIITNGSGIVVNEGQCALIIEEGNVLEVAAEPGNYTFDSAASPSVFDGGFEGIKNTFKEMWNKFTYGGVSAHNQRVYYVNTKEIMGNMYGTATPVPFRVIDKNLNLDVEMPIRCNGEYTFKIVNPLVFYQNVAGNACGYFTKEDLVKQMKAEMLTALQPAFNDIAEKGIRYYEVTGHVEELAEAMRAKLQEKWTEKRGIAFENIAVNSVSMDPENEKKLRDLQLAAVNKDANMAGATLVTAQADAMRDAANNPNGAMNGIMGVNMVQNTAGNLAGFYQNNTQPAAQTGATWTCECGSVNDGNFCPKCGKQKPASNYCPACGQPIPAGANFCPICGAKLG